MRISRRTLLVGAGAGALAVLLASCTPDEPAPAPTEPPEPTATPTPLGAVPAAAAFARSRWAEDPFAHGARSVTPVGGSPIDREVLGRPLLDRVFFAGEATSVDRPGTIIGAVESGERAAEELADASEPGERIAVVGAGAAGAAAARALVDAGIDVTVIEARDRTGGRLHTLAGDDWPVAPQLGAWILTDDTALAARMGVLGIGTVAIGDAAARTRDGEAEVPSGEPLDEAIAAAARAERDVSIADALAAAGAEPTDELTALLAARAAMTGADAEQASSWFPPAVPEGALEAAVSDIAPLVDVPLTDLPVTLSSPVSGVVYDDTGVSLRLATGEALTFDRVLLTVPLGVLADDAIEFSPPVPLERRAALAGLEMGHVESIWLRYDEPFWVSEAGIWHVIGPVGDPATETPGPSSDEESEAEEGADAEDAPVDPTIRTWINLAPSTGEPILVGIVGGEAARAFAALGDDEALTLAAKSLGPFATA